MSRPLFARVCALLPLLACAATPDPERPLAADGAAGTRDAAAAASALELLPERSTSLTARTPEDLEDPRATAFWEAAADAFGAAQRAARREALARTAAATSAGAPEPVRVSVTDHNFDPDAALLEAMVTFDLLGVLGAGPNAAAREVADAAQLVALGEYERVLWRGRVQVRRARLTLAGVRGRVAALDELARSAEPGLRRIAVLEEHGRVPADLAAGARAMAARLERLRSVAAVEEAEAVRALALAAGLAPDDRALEAVQSDLLDADPHGSHLAATAAAAQRHPDLRARELAYALAEARVRAVAARAWPGVALGPHIGAPDGSLDPLQWGGLLRLRLPWPSAWEGELAAAAQRREAAREAYEDAALALAAEARSAEERVRSLEARVGATTVVLDEGTRAVWDATTAAFLVAQRDAGAWIGALERRTNAAGAPAMDAAALALARLDVEAARGPVAAPRARATERRSTEGGVR